MCTDWCIDTAKPGTVTNLMTILKGKEDHTVTETNGNVYSCLYNNDVTAQAATSPNENICDFIEDSGCNMLAYFDLYGPAIQQGPTYWPTDSARMPTSINKTIIGGSYSITISDNSIGLIELSNSHGITSYGTTIHSTAYILTLSPTIGPTDPKYICGGVPRSITGAASGTNSPTWASDPNNQYGNQLPASWCFNIGSPFMEDYTTDPSGNIISNPDFYLMVQYNNKYYKIVYDPSVTWSYTPWEQDPKTDFLKDHGDGTHTLTNCLMDVFSQVNLSSDQSTGTTLNYPEPSLTSYNFYGHLNTNPCNGTKYNPPSGNSSHDPYILRINLSQLFSNVNSITITPDGLTYGYISVVQSIPPST